MEPETRRRIIELGKEVLKKEAQAILKVMESLDENFVRAVEIIDSCPGRVILTGMGKSGIICKKIAATLTSIGSPAIFLHPADSLHGDLGMLKKGDCIIVVSRSGETEEVIRILPAIKRLDLTTIIITGNSDSTIAKYGDVILNVEVEEACPYNIVPTSSTTASLALGDALAVALMALRKIRLEDFAFFHPGGSIGRRLLIKVCDLMHVGDEIPKVYVDTSMKDTILEITCKRLGITGVYNKDDELVGVITDGDLRRGMEKYPNLLEKKAQDVMTCNPKTILKEDLAVNALKKMEHYSITSLFVLEKEGDKRPVGIIHIHDLLRAKIF